MTTLPSPARGQQQLSTCVGGPFEKAVVDTNPLFLQYCYDPPPPCLQPPPPTVLAAPWQQAQGLKLEGQAPAELGTPARAFWSVEVSEPGLGLRLLYNDESNEGIELPAVPYGAAGLRRGVEHFFRVGFSGADGKSTCWSDRSSGTTNTAFQAVGPTPPPATTLLVEDAFRRPATDPKGPTAGNPDGGAGMGATEVWLQDSLDGSAERLPSIYTDQASLYMPPSSSAVYVASGASDPHSYAEIEFHPLDPAKQAFNIAVMARVDLWGTGAKFYQAKAVREHLKACALTLFLLKPSELDALLQTPLQGDPCNTCADFTFDAAVPAEACFQIGAADPQPDFSEDVWLRIEVFNDGAFNPNAIATLAWGCSDNQPMLPANCTGTVSHVRVDHGDPDGMRFVQGTWAIENHDLEQLAGIFRGGSATP